MKSETIKTEPESEKVKNEPKSDEESKVAVKEEPSHEYSDDDIPLVMIAMHFIYRVNVNLFRFRAPYSPLVVCNGCYNVLIHSSLHLS